MSVRRAKSKREAGKNYNRLMAENLLMLEEITDAIRARKEAVTDPNWGDAGDAGHYHEKLLSIRDQLLHLGEYAE